MLVLVPNSYTESISIAHFYYAVDSSIAAQMIMLLTFCSAQSGSKNTLCAVTLGIHKIMSHHAVNLNQTLFPVMMYCITTLLMITLHYSVLQRSFIILGDQ
jgi:hypothetical protein